MARSYRRDQRGRFASTSSGSNKAIGGKSGKGGTGLTRVRQNNERASARINSTDPKERAKAMKSATTARKAKAEWLDRAGAALAKAGRGTKKYAR